jgi:hypothetical protein
MRAIDSLTFWKIMSETRGDFVTLELASKNTPHAIPIMLAVMRAITNRETILEIFNCPSFFEMRSIMLKVTDENVMGITDIEIKIKKMSAKGRIVRPKFGNINPINPATTTDKNVVYPPPKAIFSLPMQK